MQAILSISAVTFGFIAYHFTTQSGALRRQFDRRFGAERSKVYWIYFQRMTGVFYYGVIPLVLVLSQKMDLQQTGINTGHATTSLLWISGLSAAVILLNFFAARSPDNLAMYPQIRTAVPWSSGLIAGSAVTWILYLLAYEFLFRGFLLFTCEAEMGKWLAIAINVSIYALVHVPKGWKETVGAIPLGIVLCLLTLQTGNIWIAVLVHVAMALSNEWWSLYYAGRRSVMD